MRYAVWHSRTFKSWLMCFIVVLAIPLVFFVAFFSRSQLLLEQKLHANNHATIKQVGSMFDEWFTTVNDVENSIGISDDIKRINNLSLPYSADAYYKLHAYSKGLMDFTRHSIIDSVYVYWTPMGCLLDGVHVYTLDNQLQSTIENRLHTTSEWLLRQLAAYQHNTFYCVGRGTILAMKTLDIGRTPKKTVIVKLNMKNASELLNSIEESSRGEAYVLFEDNQVFSGSSEPSTPIGYHEFDDASGDTPRTIDGYLVSCANSKLPGIRYVIAVPKEVYLRDLNRMKQEFILFMAGIVLLGTLMSVLLTRRNYKPVAELKRLVDVGEVPAQDDFIQLNRKLTQLQQDSTRLRNQLQQLSKIVDDRMLHLLITGGYMEPEERMHLEKLRATLDGATFACMLVAVVNAEDKSEQKSKALLGLKEWIQQWIEQYRDKDAWHCVVCVEGYQLGLVFCFSALQNANDAQLAVHEVAERMLNAAAKDMPELQMQAFIGEACMTLDDIASSYQHAINCMEYCDYLMRDAPEIIMYTPAMVTTSVAWNHYDAYDVERQFMKAMVDGDYVQGQNLLNDLISYYDYKDGTSIYVMRCRMFGLINMLLNLFHEITPDVDTSFYENNRIEESLLAASTMIELKHTILHIFDQLVGIKESQGTGSLRAGTVEKYVAHHYFEESLSVQQIADAFHVSVPFLSRMFKKETNGGMLDFINRYRIQKVKEMIQRDPEVTISEAARSVGYNTSQTLIRVFKRYENTTPGQWKNACCASESAQKNDQPVQK